MRRRFIIDDARTCLGQVDYRYRLQGTANRISCGQENVNFNRIENSVICLNMNYALHAIDVLAIRRDVKSMANKKRGQFPLFLSNAILSRTQILKTAIPKWR